MSQPKMYAVEWGGTCYCLAMDEDGAEQAAMDALGFVDVADVGLTCEAVNEVHHGDRYLPAADIAEWGLPWQAADVEALDLPERSVAQWLAWEAEQREQAQATQADLEAAGQLRLIEEVTP